MMGLSRGMKAGRHRDWGERVGTEAERGAHRLWDTKGCRMGRGDRG